MLLEPSTNASVLALRAAVKAEGVGSAAAAGASALTRLLGWHSLSSAWTLLLLPSNLLGLRSRDGQRTS